MAKRSVSPKSQQRARVFEAYRGRGHRNNNLWLVYSIKTQRDWILTSDRQLVHWICFLETNCRVKSFELMSERNLAFDSSAAEWDSIGADVTLFNGMHEWHEVIVRHEPSYPIDVSTPRSPAQSKISHKIFTDLDLAPYVSIAMRWLKAIAYAAVIRDQEHPHVLTALWSTIRSREHGLLRDIMHDTANHDVPIIIGLLVRLAIQGYIDLDLGSNPFSQQTPWRWRMENDHVDA